MKRFVGAVLAVFMGFALVTVGGAFVQETGTGEGMTDSAQKYLASLNDEQRAQSVMDYDTPDRMDWHFIPKAHRKGLQIKEMDESQRELAHELLRNCLSQIGYHKATQIMEMENLLEELETGRTGTPLRDPYRYYYTIFGEPKSDGRWGLSIEGHHLSLNFVVEGNKVVSSTPTLFAANPAVVRTKSSTKIDVGTRLLTDEEVLAFQLLETLTPDQKEKAIIASQPLSELRNAGEKEPPQADPAGLAAEAMSREQVNLLRKLVESYANNLPGEIAEARMEEIREAGPGKVHFAWAGSETPGSGHYYRIQGPTFLIEFVNTQPDAAGNLANHIHCVWRDIRGDFAVALNE
jgi:hypothetical protein